MKAFIFSKKIGMRLMRHLAFWLIVILLFMIKVTLWRDDTWDNFTLHYLIDNFSQIYTNFLTFVLLLAVPYTYFIVYYLRPKYLSNSKYVYFTIGFAFATIADAGLKILLIYLYNFELIVFPKIIYTAVFHEFLTVYPLFCCTFLSLKLFKTSYEKQAEKELLIKEKTEAEIRILKAQVHPHFIFNTLNNIYSFALSKSPKAKKLVSNLYEIMKYMINDCDVEMIDLNKELKILNDYIELEKVRYGERLLIEVDITGEIVHKKITPLLMIPFVENSFKHGASKLLHNPWIKLFIQADQNVLHFTLSNSKPANEIKQGKGGIGLSNAKKRLELLYPSDHLLLIESTENTFTVNMQIPVFPDIKINKENITYA